jgi:hypothetical protein
VRCDPARPSLANRTFPADAAGIRRLPTSRFVPCPRSKRGRRGDNAIGCTVRAVSSRNLSTSWTGGPDTCYKWTACPRSGALVALLKGPPVIPLDQPCLCSSIITTIHTLLVIKPTPVHLRQSCPAASLATFLSLLPMTCSQPVQPVASARSLPHYWHSKPNSTSAPTTYTYTCVRACFGREGRLFFSTIFHHPLCRRKSTLNAVVIAPYWSTGGC